MSTPNIPTQASGASLANEEARIAGMSRSVRTAYFVLLALALTAPALGLYPVYVMKLMCFALFACAFNLLLGFTGLLSFGHAAFFGLASYVAAWLAKAAGWTPELAMTGGAAVGALLGFCVGFVAIRRRGIYFSMITLGLAQMVFFLCLQAPFTGGEDGLQNVPRGKLFGLLSLASDTSMYYFVLGVFVAAFLGIRRIVTSPFGQVLRMIRENEPRAISLGYRVEYFKLIAFVLSAALAGLAGGLKSLVMGFATLADVHWSMSGEVILMSLLGGVGTFVGPVVGSSLVVSLENLLADRVGAWVTVIIGLTFMVCAGLQKGRRRRTAGQDEATAYSHVNPWASVSRISMTATCSCERILALEDARARALLSADIASLGAMLAESVTYGHSSGATDGRQGLLLKIQSGQLKFTELRLSESTVRILDGCALVTGRMQASALIEGQARDVDTTYLAVWTSDPSDAASTWRLQAYQGTSLPRQTTVASHH